MDNETIAAFLGFILQKVPITDFRAKFDSKCALSILQSFPDIVFSYMDKNGIGARSYVKPTWVKEFLAYIFDECALDVNAVWTVTNVKPLDRAIYYLSENTVVIAVDFLLARGAKSHMSLEKLLEYYHDKHRYNDSLCKRLIDAGAKPPSQLYHSRQATRSVCIALLSLPWKLPLGQGVRQWLPRDVLRVVGKMIWSQRFEYKGRV